MPTEVSEKRPVVSPLQIPPKQTEPLPCPRCNSTNTKFCYYNNYNLSQPRHFCKGCRRYWTQGGTLRNIPVGGGTRKTSTRSRSSNSTTTTSPSSSSTTTATSNSTTTFEPEPVPVTANSSSVSPLVKVENGDGFNLNEKSDGFCALVNPQGHGLVDPYVYGSGFGFGFCEMGLGYGGRAVWSYPGLSYIGGGGVGSGDALGNGTSGCNTWQLGDVGSGGDGLNVLGECDGFAWPGLAISAPGKSMK